MSCEKESLFKQGAKQLNSSQGSLQAILRQTAEKLPEKIAITYSDRKLSYYELEDFSSKFASALAVCGVENGCRVALFLQNSPHFVISYFGALKAGVVITVINPLYREREVQQQLYDSGAQIIVTVESLYPIVERIRDKTLLKKIIVTTGEGFFLKTVGIKTSLSVSSFEDLIEDTVDRQSILQFNSNELAMLQYTGGTTGRPKGVMLTHDNLVSNARSFASWIKGVSNDVFLVALPLFHIYGMTTSMLTPISLGAEMVLLPQFNSIKSLQAIKQHKVTVFCGSPAMYTALLANSELGKYNLKSIRLCISGASPLSAQVQERFIRLTGCLLIEGYGLTEASPVTHCTPIDSSMRLVKFGSIGVPLPGTEARIVDVKTGCKVLAVGEIGELAVRGPQVMQGYWQKPDETSQVFRDDWLLTGDIAYIDSDGYFYIINRKKDLIKHKDLSVYPRELEDILYEHPDVKLCAVIGKPDALSGEVPKAFVVLKEGVNIAAGAEIAEFVNSKIAAYKAIAEVEFCKELPNSLTGKVLKPVFREKIVSKR